MVDVVDHVQVPVLTVIAALHVTAPETAQVRIDTASVPLEVVSVPSKVRLLPNVSVLPAPQLLMKLRRLPVPDNPNALATAETMVRSRTPVIAPALSKMPVFAVPVVRVMRNPPPATVPVAIVLNSAAARFAPSVSVAPVTST